MVLSECQVKGGAPIVVGGVDIRAAPQQQAHRLRVPLFRSQHQGGVAETVTGIDISPIVKKQTNRFDGAGAPGGSGKNEGRASALTISDIHGNTAGQERFDFGGIASHGRQEQAGARSAEGAMPSITREESDAEKGTEGCRERRAGRGSC